MVLGVVTTNVPAQAGISQVGVMVNSEVVWTISGSPINLNTEVSVSPFWTFGKSNSQPVFIATPLLKTAGK